MTRTHARLLAFFGAILFGLLLSEFVIRVFAFDWRFVSRLLYLQSAELPSHEVDPSPELHYRLRPGVVDYGAHRVSVNSLYARGPERPVEKPPGTFRVIVVGGSNAYGAIVGDDATWPAQLESELNRTGRANYEVWNYGTSAYVTSQMVARAGWALEHLAPDLIIIALSNLGSPGFIQGRGNEELFRGTPWLWYRFVFDARLQGDRTWLDDRTWLWWIGHSRMFRMFQLTRVERNGVPPLQLSPDETYGRAKLHIFLNSTRSQVKTAIFVCPAITEEMVAGYWQDLDVPSLILTAEDKPETWKAIHPTPEVLEWYARELAAWLVRERIVPVFEGATP
ncbi:MAG: hypothetical protein KJ042_09590 [Deltaproteobacteria bacterium]|nr:hypothetical protein [Deltaproteobacteria bacterium]